MWYQGTLGVMLRKSRCDSSNLSFFFFNFTIHGSLFTAQEQPPKPWLFSFVSSPNSTNPCPLWKPYYPYYFLAYSPPKPNPNSSKPKLYQIYSWFSKSNFCCFPLSYVIRPLPPSKYPTILPFKVIGYLRLVMHSLTQITNLKGFQHQ